MCVFFLDFNHTAGGREKEGEGEADGKGRGSEWEGVNLPLDLSVNLCRPSKFRLEISCR